MPLTGELARIDFPGLRTARLQLRRLILSDVPAISRYRSLPEVARYQSWDTFTTEDGERLVADQTSVAPDTPGTWFQLAIEAEEVIGDCGLHFLDNEQVEVGITLDPAHQGLGYAAEGLQAALDYLFGTLAKHRVVATTDAENAPAAALFARLGFRREAHYVKNVWFKGRWGDELLFAMLADEWAKARKLPPSVSFRDFGGFTKVETVPAGQTWLNPGGG